MTMRRTVVLVLILSLGNTSMALAGETLLASATRVVRDAVRTTPNQSKMAAAKAFEQAPAVSTTGMKKRTKTLIFVAAAASFVAAAYAIDHGVKDVTPSTLGTR